MHIFYATEAWGQKSKWVKRKRLHCTDMPTWSKGEKIHEGRDERCLGATNFETIGNDGQENAQGVAERYNILKKNRQKQCSCDFMSYPQYAGHGGGRNYFLWSEMEHSTCTIQILSQCLASVHGAAGRIRTCAGKPHWISHCWLEKYYYWHPL